MKILVMYPKYLKNKVIHDLENEKKKAQTFSTRTSTGKVGQMLGLVGRVNPILKNSLNVDYKWSDVTDTSLKLEVIMPVEALLKPEVLYGTIRTQFIRSYKQLVKTKLIK